MRDIQRAKKIKIEKRRQRKRSKYGMYMVCIFYARQTGINSGRKKGRQRNRIVRFATGWQIYCVHF